MVSAPMNAAPVPARLTRYLLSTVIGSVLSVAAVLTGLYFSVDLVREAGDMSGGYGLAEVFGFLARTLPARLYDLFPFAALIGTMVALGRLAAGSELIAMRACGFDQLRISVRVLVAGLSLGLVVMLIGETVAPALELDARIDREQALERQVGAASGSSLWLRDGQLMIRAGLVIWEREDRVRFADLRIYELDANGGLARVLHAESGRHIGGRWLLGGATELDSRSATVTGHGDASLDLSSDLRPNVFRALATRPRLLPIGDILTIRRYLEANGQDAAAYDQALWRRVLYPIHLLAMVFSGVALLLFGGRRLPPALGVFAGVSLGIGFFVVHRLVLGMAPVLPVPLWITHLIPAALFAALGLALLRR
jgi:lipopolysaccharide export system permease protein